METLIGHDAVEFEFVAASFATNHVFGPAAGLDCGMGADDSIMLLGEVVFSRIGELFLFFVDLWHGVSSWKIG